jgi:hypothetical protein
MLAVRFGCVETRSIERLSQIQGGVLQKRQPLPPLGALMLVLIAMENQMQHRMHSADLRSIHDGDAKTATYHSRGEPAIACRGEEEFGVWRLE